jgi:hypothetical protein
MGLLGGALVGGCGGDSAGDTGRFAGASNTPQPQVLDTRQALAMAEQSSDTAPPFAVDDGTLLIADTSETSTPLVIDAT